MHGGLKVVDYKELSLRLCLATGGVKIYNFQVFDGSLIKKQHI